MKILVVGHAYVASINRQKWQAFARLYPDVELLVAFPKRWPDTLFTLESDRASDDNLFNCRFVSLDAVKEGNETLYRYRTGQLISLLRSFRPQIIHVEQGDQALSYAQIGLCARMAGIKAKMTFFTWINWKEKRSWRYRLLWRWVERWNLYQTDGVFAGNADAKQLLYEKGFNKDVCVLPQLGVDLTFFSPATLKTDKNFHIACIGRLVAEKGVFTLLDAFACVAQKNPHWNLLFVGRGPAVGTLQEKIKEYGLVSRVQIRDSVSHEAVPGLLQTIDLLVLPSYDVPTWKEQFGHILIEAMACGVPVIGSDGGEIPNVIGTAGLIFKQRDVRDLARCLEQCMANENERAVFSQKGLDRVRELYSHEAIAQRTYQFWQSL